MSMFVRRWLGALVLLGAVACAAEQDDRPAEFQYIARAILRPSCATASCHSSQAKAGDVELETPEKAYESLLGPTGTGDYVVPENPTGSKLMQLLRGENIARMPPDQPLPDADIALIEAWILAGARERE